jgi:hypothetical protein
LPETPGAYAKVAFCVHAEPLLVETWNPSVMPHGMMVPANAPHQPTARRIDDALNPTDFMIRPMKPLELVVMVTSAT